MGDEEREGEVGRRGGGKELAQQKVKYILQQTGSGNIYYYRVVQCQLKPQPAPPRPQMETVVSYVAETDTS